MRTVLITGISGFLGANLAEILVENPTEYSCTGFYNSFRSLQLKGPSLQTLRVDIREKRTLSRAMQALQPEVIIHCAALREVEYCEKYPEEAGQVNTQGTENIVQCSNELGAKLVFISTDIVFDGSEPRYLETTPTHPLNVYGKTKAVGEKLVMEILPENAWLIVRLSVLYGCHPLGRRNDFTGFVIDRLSKNEEVKLFTDKYRNVTYVPWAGQIILKLIEHECTGIYHVCGDECINNLDWGIMIAEEFELPSDLIVPIKIEGFFNSTKRPKKVLLDNTKLREEVGAHAMMSRIQETLKAIKREKCIGSKPKK